MGPFWRITTIKTPSNVAIIPGLTLSQQLQQAQLANGDAETWHGTLRVALARWNATVCINIT